MRVLVLLLVLISSVGRSLYNVLTLRNTDIAHHLFFPERLAEPNCMGSGSEKPVWVGKAYCVFRILVGALMRALERGV